MNDDWIIGAPREPLGFLPTPLVPLARLSADLGGPRIWLKRDDCAGLATGGNKTRKLEYLLADARRQGADAVVTFGAAQSNHARQTAAACAAVGLPCHLLLSRKVPWTHPGYHTSGNVLLDDLLGAEVHLLAPDALAGARIALLRRLEAGGLLPYVIPVGGSDTVGAMGYARCALELLEQSREAGFALTDVVHASSSGGTQAGLLIGFAGLLADEPARTAPRLLGVDVSEPDPETLPATVLALANGIATERGLGISITTDQVRVARHVGAGYGIPTPEAVEAIRLLGRTEGILLDPVYSGKGFAALLERIRRGDFDGVRDVVFIHTGGTVALAVYDDAF
ncbi:MAG: D-cysteine desulfhydrase family protein [Pseudomonadota bacterium]